jgi:hypothetical protein
MAMKRLYLFGVLMLAILINSPGSFAADAPVCKLMQKQFEPQYRSRQPLNVSSVIKDTFGEDPTYSGLSVPVGERLIVSNPFKAEGVQWAKWTTAKGFDHVWFDGGYGTSIIATADIQPGSSHILALTIGGIGWRGHRYRIYNVPKSKLGQFIEKAKTADPLTAFVFDATFANKFYPTLQMNDDSQWLANIFSYQNEVFSLDYNGSDNLTIYQLSNNRIRERCEIQNPIPQTTKNLCSSLSGMPGLPKQSTDYSPDKEFILSAETDPKTEDIHVKLKSVKSGKTKILETMEHQSFGSLGSRDEGIMKNRVQFSKQGSLVAVSGASASNVSLFDTSNWKKVLSFGYAAFSLSPNGRYLAVAGFGWKFGWELSIFEIVEKGKEFVIGGKRRISGTSWCGVSGAEVCSADVTSKTMTYEGEEFGFSEDSNYLVIDGLDEGYFSYDLLKNSLEKRSCAL